MSNTRKTGKSLLWGASFIFRAKASWRPKFFIFAPRPQCGVHKLPKFYQLIKKEFVEYCFQKTAIQKPTGEVR
jgi:hypothetical protein